MELQILDNISPRYKNLKDYQYHGSIYGVVAANYGVEPPTKCGLLKSGESGEWNYEEVVADGSKITIKLNGTTIVDADISKLDVSQKVLDGHPGLKNEKGYISFCGHGSKLWFRNLRIKELD